MSAYTDASSRISCNKWCLLQNKFTSSWQRPSWEFPKEHIFGEIERLRKTPRERNAVSQLLRKSSRRCFCRFWVLRFQSLSLILSLSSRETAWSTSGPVARRLRWYHSRCTLRFAHYQLSLPFQQHLHLGQRANTWNSQIGKFSKVAHKQIRSHGVLLRTLGSTWQRRQVCWNIDISLNINIMNVVMCIS